VAVKVNQLRETNQEFTKLYNKATESFNRLEMIVAAQMTEVQVNLKNSLQKSSDNVFDKGKTGLSDKKRRYTKYE